MIRQYDVSVFRIWMITQMFFSFFRKSDLIFPPTSGNPIFFKYFALIQKQTRPSEIYGGVTPVTQYDGCCTMSMAAINGMDRMGYQTILNHLKPFEQPARKIQVTNLDIVDKLGMGDICQPAGLNILLSKWKWRWLPAQRAYSILVISEMSISWQEFTRRGYGMRLEAAE